MSARLELREPRPLLLCVLHRDLSEQALALCFIFSCLPIRSTKQLSDSRLSRSTKPRSVSRHSAAGSTGGSNLPSLFPSNWVGFCIWLLSAVFGPLMFRPFTRLVTELWLIKLLMNVSETPAAGNCYSPVSAEASSWSSSSCWSLPNIVGIATPFTPLDSLYLD